MRILHNGRQVRSLSDVLDPFLHRQMERARIATLEAAVEVAEEIKHSTPVLTGRAAENVTIGVNGNNPEYDPSLTGSGRGGVDVSRLEGFRPGDKITIANGTPYFGLLEEGSSSQAPNGMVGTAVLAWGDRVERLVRKTK